MNKKPDFLGLAITAGTARSQEQRLASAIISSAQSSVADVDGILPRKNAPTRELSPEHVLALASSIAQLGMIEPIAIDKGSRLVAGAHRLAALRLLNAAQDGRRDVWMQLFPQRIPGQEFAELERLEPISRPVPVHILGFDSETDPATALLIEVAENEKRRNYSHEEVRGFAMRLQDAGYRRQDGRPRQGERALIPVLAATLGVSTRTVKRALAPESAPKTVTRVTVFNPYENARLVAALRRWLGTGEHPARSLAIELLTVLGGNTDAPRAEADENHNDLDVLPGPGEDLVHRR